MTETPASAPALRRDLWVVTLLLCSVLVELAIRELYYRLSQEVPRLLLVSLVWALIVAITLTLRHRCSDRSARVAGRLGTLVALMTWIDIVAAPALSVLFGAGLFADLAVLLIDVLLIGSAWFALRMRGAQWLRISQMAAAGCVIFVLSQPVVAALRAPALSWPDRNAGRDAATAGDTRITVFLLLDELNAGSAGPIVEALAPSGLPVRMKALDPAGDATGQVIPAMFSGQRFGAAKPCGLSTVCSGANVLDFSKVQASRPDVDVVGFYEPYCAIRGLRSCERLSPPSPALDVRRWWCAALRRSATLLAAASSAASTQCAYLGGDVWSSLVTDVEAALWRAPVWNRGGFLYAHLPLPHPPGVRAGGSLSEHYRENLQRVAGLIGQIAKRVQGSPDVSIVVFSDHPLREKLWCISTQYSHNGCPLEPTLVDTQVPLIVAGRVPPGFDRVRSNMQVFDLASRGSP